MTDDHSRHDVALPSTESAEPGHAEDLQAGEGHAHQAPDMAMEMEMPHGLATPWAHFFAAIILGVWLITSPVSLGYRSTPVSLGYRSTPMSLDFRSTALIWSDIISGALIIAFATVTLVRRSSWAPWANALVGVWLLFAPLVFWAPTAVAYANDTLAGALVIAFVLLMPGMPGMRMLPGPDVPPGWSYNPSTWLQRAPIIALALVAFFLSRYMAGYQLGYIGAVWDPFFGEGTQRVLHSDISRAFPISDAGLGAVAYTLEALMGFMGDRQRWRTMPWMVTFFGILVVPLGVVSITLIILQPVSVGQWCWPCLGAALAMLIMITLTLDEVVAMGQFLVQAHHEGQPLWRTFWLGGTLAEVGHEERPTRPAVSSAKAMVWGVALPWNLLASTAIGLWLMAAPAVLNTVPPAAHSDHLIGALVVTVAMISLSDVGRALRYVNVLFGAWFIVAPWVLGGATTSSTVSDIIAGVALIVLSLPRGPVGERYGNWQRLIR